MSEVHIDQAAEGYEIAAPRDAGDDAWKWPKGAPQSAGWTPLEIFIYDSPNWGPPYDVVHRDLDDEERDEDSDDPELWLPADCPTMKTGKIVCRDAVADVVRGALGPYGELLPLWEPVREERLWLFNPLVVADVLDEDRSELYRGAASGRITGIKRWVFHDDRLGPLGAFLVPQSSHLCLTGEPLGRLLAAGLSGLALFCVWRSDQDRST